MTTTRYIAPEVLADPKVQQLILAAVPAFRSPDPAASFTWMASIETDDDLKFAFTKAAELVRARREIDTS